MNRSKRLAVVENLIASQEQKMAQAVSRAKDNLRIHTEKLEELKSYLKTYEQEFQDNGRKGLSSRQWLSYQHFMTQLEQLIGTQNQAVRMAEAQVADIMKRWQAVHIKRKSMSTLIESVRFEEWVEQEKKEQKQNDELVSQMFANNKNGF